MRQDYACLQTATVIHFAARGIKRYSLDLEKMMNFKSRWALVPVAVITAFIGAIALSIPMNRVIRALYWSAGHHMPGKEFLMIVMQYDGALAAFMVVVMGSMTAPRGRRATGLVIFLVGAAVAWTLVGDMTPTTSPLMGTYIGGLLGLLAINIKESRRKRSKHAVVGTSLRAAPHR
jgi:hypothetical protein